MPSHVLFMVQKSVHELFFSSLVWDQREKSPCDIYSTTRKKLQKSSTKACSYEVAQLLCTAKMLTWCGWAFGCCAAGCQCQTSSALSASAEIHHPSFPTGTTSPTVTCLACSQTAVRQPKHRGFQWVQDHVPHLCYKLGMVCSKALPIIHHPRAHPSKQEWGVTTNEVGPQLSPPRNIHLRNTLFTIVLGRSIIRNCKGKEKKKKKRENCFFPPPGRNFPPAVHSKNAQQQSWSKGH